MHKYKPGDVLSRPLEGIPILLHFGIYVSESEVIHVTHEDGMAAATTLAGFSRGLPVSRSGFSSLVKDPAQTVERARGMVGKWRYNFIAANCEAFVLWCATGKKSEGLQVILGKRLLGISDPPKAARRHVIRTDRGVLPIPIGEAAKRRTEERARRYQEILRKTREQNTRRIEQGAKPRKG